MLWQKEAHKSDAPYIDLLNDVNYPIGSFRMNRKKNDIISQISRKQGNQMFLRNDFKSAMKNYNESVSFAESSEYLSLAYGNRSCCFFKLNMFDRCLVDIQLAKDNNYPNNLMQKLDNRKEQCLKALDSMTKSILREPLKLSFEKNNELPCMASVLKIEKDDFYGRIVTAKEDISIGQTLLIEKAYVRSVSGDEFRCEVCGKPEMNFIPCKTCADTLYCSNECADNSFHETECDIIFGHQNMCDSASLSFILRSIIIGINAFSTINEMMEFVESSLIADRHEICSFNETPKSKYRMFFKLSSFVTDQRILDFRKKAFYIFHAAMSSHKLSNKFQTKSTQLFLIHLIVQHGLILSTNSFGGCCNDDGDYEQNIFLLTSYINHSCIPNVIKLSHYNLSIVKTIQPIEKGQQLFVSYLLDPGDMTGRDRNIRLEEIYGFLCQCELCTKGFKTGSRFLEEDKDFTYVAENIRDCDNLLVEIKQHCITFLLKYLHMLPSEEGFFILNTLGAIFQKEISG